MTEGRNARWYPISPWNAHKITRRFLRAGFLWLPPDGTRRERGSTGIGIEQRTALSEQRSAKGWHLRFLSFFMAFIHSLIVFEPRQLPPRPMHSQRNATNKELRERTCERRKRTLSLKNFSTKLFLLKMKLVQSSRNTVRAIQSCLTLLSLRTFCKTAPSNLFAKPNDLTQNISRHPSECPNRAEYNDTRKGV